MTDRGRAALRQSARRAAIGPSRDALGRRPADHRYRRGVRAAPLSACAGGSADPRGRDRGRTPLTPDGAHRLAALRAVAQIEVDADRRLALGWPRLFRRQFRHRALEADFAPGHGAASRARRGSLLLRCGAARRIDPGAGHALSAGWRAPGIDAAAATPLAPHRSGRCGAKRAAIRAPPAQVMADAGRAVLQPRRWCEPGSTARHVRVCTRRWISTGSARRWLKPMLALRVPRRAAGAFGSTRPSRGIAPPDRGFSAAAMLPRRGRARTAARPSQST